MPATLRRRVVPAALERLQRLGGPVGRWARRARRVAIAGRDPHVIRWEYDPLSQKGFRGLLTDVLHPRLKKELEDRDPDRYWGRVFAASDGPTPVDRVLYTELRTLLPDEFLVKTDVATMAYGLEARCPLLDPTVIQLAASIPASVKSGWLATKRLLRKVAAKHVPPEVIDRPKHGFLVPTGAWLRGAGTLPSQILLSDEALKRGFFAPAAIRRLIDEHRAGRADHGQRLWALLVLELWMRMFVDRTLTSRDRLDDPTEMVYGSRAASGRGAGL